MLNRQCINTPLRRFYTTIRTKPAVYVHSHDPLHIISLSPSPNAIPIGQTFHTPSQFIAVTPSDAADFSSPTNARPTVIPKPQDFQINPVFSRILQSIVAKNIHKSEIYTGLAEGERFQGGSTFHVYDMRDPPPYGRIPEVQDIVGTVRLEEEGKEVIVPDSFEFNPMYRVLSMYGFVNLGDELNMKLRKACEEYEKSS